MVWTYIIIAVQLLAVELLYFKIADKCNIIDKPNQRSSHTTIVLRGGGIIFAISMIIWFVWQSFSGGPAVAGMPDQVGHDVVEGRGMMVYLPFIIGLVLICGVSFWDDVHSLPDSVRLVAQFTAMALMFWSMGILHWNMWWVVILALIVCVGATNIFNFMDGINGITAGYALTVLVPLVLLNGMPGQAGHDVMVAGHDGLVGFERAGFIEPSYLIVAIIGVLVFCFFNFRPKGKAKCFAGDVGSIGIAFILLFAIGRLIVHTGDVTYLILVLVYGVDGFFTIVHRILLHENLGEAHRKHAYQIMANELRMDHRVVSLIYMALQLAVSLGFIYLCPNTVLAHWIYLVGALALLTGAYVLFMKKYYHLHEEYLASLKDARS